ncbi:ATP-binding cassette domain-containing protein [Vibrio atypicus]|uniref:ATP-binding cassette domain-containing protein n=1 Tax=Vibrio atypicus TaxID=558271 RepID=UPI001358247C|nr:ATP-binding cassette domain-containing protein [Vibrio atypicus]
MLSLNQVSVYDAKTDSTILDSITFHVNPHEMVAIVGGSGSGKTVLTQIIMQALPCCFHSTGELHWVNPLVKPAALITQHTSALNPNITIGVQLRMFAQRNINIPCLLNTLGLSNQALSAYPHQLSGGIAKRVLSCLALVQGTPLLLADEPSCGLDSSNAIRLMTLYKSWSKLTSSFLIISHDLSLMCQFVDRILIMNEGTIIEETTPAQIISGQCHSYTQALWQSQPRHWYL